MLFGRLCNLAMIVERERRHFGELVKNVNAQFECLEKGSLLT